MKTYRTLWLGWIYPQRRAFLISWIVHSDGIMRLLDTKEVSREELVQFGERNDLPLAELFLDLLKASIGPYTALGINLTDQLPPELGLALVDGRES